MNTGSRVVALFCLALAPGACLAQAFVAAFDPQQAANLPNIVSTKGPTLVEKGTAVAGHEDALRKLGHEVKQDNLQSG